MALRQFHQTVNPFNGLAESVVTGNPQYVGDATMVSFSIITSSGTASRWTWLGYDGNNAQDGFMTALPAVNGNAWSPIKTAAAAGFYSFDTLTRWAVMLRTPSASSSTIRVTIFTGP